MKYDFAYFHRNLLANQNIRYEDYKDKTEFDIFLSQLRSEAIYQLSEIDWSLFVDQLLDLGMDNLNAYLFDPQLRLKVLLYLQMHMASYCKSGKKLEKRVIELEKDCARLISAIINDRTPIFSHGSFADMPPVDYYQYMQSKDIFTEKTPSMRWLEMKNEEKLFLEADEDMFPHSGPLTEVDDWGFDYPGCFFYVAPGFYHTDGIYFLPAPIKADYDLIPTELSLKLNKKLKKYKPLASNYAAIKIVDMITHRVADYDYDDVKDYIEQNVESYQEDGWAALYEILENERILFETLENEKRSTLLHKLLESVGQSMITVVGETKKFIRTCIYREYSNPDILKGGKIDFVKAFWSSDEKPDNPIDLALNGEPILMELPGKRYLKYIREEGNIPHLVIDCFSGSIEVGMGFVACLYNMERNVTLNDMCHLGAENDILSWDWYDRKRIEHPTLMQRTAHFSLYVEDCNFNYKCRVKDLYVSYSKYCLEAIEKEREQSPRQGRLSNEQILLKSEIAGIRQYLNSELEQLLNVEQKNDARNFLIGLLEYWHEEYELEIGEALRLFTDSPEETLPDVCEEKFLWPAYTGKATDEDKLLFENKMRETCSSRKKSLSKDVKDYLKIKEQEGIIVRPSQTNTEYDYVKLFGYPYKDKAYYNA